MLKVMVLLCLFSFIVLFYNIASKLRVIFCVK